jgi:hypothetical protein
MRPNPRCEAIESVGQDKLKQPLLQRYTDGGFDGRGKGLPLIRVNFDSALTKLLREVKYLKLLSLAVPQSAEAIYMKNEVFRQQIGNLELLANIYNNILFTLIDVEKPMVQPKLDKIDEQLTHATTVLTWRSNGALPTRRPPYDRAAHFDGVLTGGARFCQASRTSSATPCRSSRRRTASSSASRAT